MEMNMTNLLWFFAVILLAGGNGLGGLFGGNRPPVGPPPATQQDLTNAINNQTLQNELNALGISTANNNYETSRLITEQNMQMQAQNNTNSINLMQQFNAIMQQLAAQNASLSQQIQALGYQMSACCCELKTQNLENRLIDKTAEAAALQAKLDNREQTQTILNNLGRFVAWAGSGSLAAGASS